MIKKITSFSEIKDFINRDIYSIRILSLAKAYGFDYSFASFYIQVDAQQITALISKLDSDFTVSLADNYDTKEIESFLFNFDYNSILTDEKIELNSRFSSGTVMATDRKKEILLPYVHIDEYPKLMDLFNLNDYNTADFESWYVDLSHRIRHGCAKAFTLNVNDEIISSSILSSIYDNYAILSAVETKPEFRNIGYGSVLVSHIINDFNGTIYLMREKNKNAGFYNNLGFKDIGTFKLYRSKN